MKRIALPAVFALLAGCMISEETPPAPGTSPVDQAAPAESTGVQTGGIRMIPIHTPKGDFRVWTKTVGSNARIKVLLLHGGPGGTHEYFEAFDSLVAPFGIEYIYYDQLGSYYSDQPDDPELLSVPRFVDEVEQVRTALGLDKNNFYLLGHSWGGILAVEYALAHQDHLKGLIISNMMMSIPEYNDYAEKTLKPSMDPKVVAEIAALEKAGRTDDPRYMELLVPNFYCRHFLRMPAGQWPDPVNRLFRHLNLKVYAPMQGPSEFHASGILEHWDRFGDLNRIAVPTLVIGARYDTMDPAHMERVAKALPRGRYLYCPEGSHMSLYDDQRTWFDGVTAFLHDSDAGSF